MEVSSNAVGRRNLLVNSDFHNQESLYFSSGTRIECTTGKDGINCVHITSSSENGVYWDGTKSGGMSVVITKGKKYTFSCWVKSSSTSAQFRIRAYSTSDISNASSKTDFYETVWMNVSSPNTWEQFTFTIDTSSAVTNYLAVIFCVSGASDAYICQPMMEDGDTYKGWSLSQQDYDYVGGNLLDNTTKLLVDGNLTMANGITNNDYEGTYSVSHIDKSGSGYTNMLYWDFTNGGSNPLKQGKDYILSFLAKGRGQITCYLYKDGTPSLMVESEGTQPKTNADGEQAVTVSSEWKRYWVHYRIIGSTLPIYVLFRIYSGNNIYIAKPKLEVGSLMTEYTERKTDLVDKATIKKAGIEITTNQIKLYGDKVQVLTRKDENSEYVEAGMFVNGKLNANLIDADKIEVKHLWAKSEDGTTKVGYFGNYEIDACKVNNANAPLFVGADTAAKSPFYVTNKGHMVSTSATLGCFSLDKMSLRYISGYDDEEPGFALYNNFMLFREYSRTFNPDTHTWKSERKRTVWMGEYKTTYQVPALLSNLLIDDSFSVNGDTLKSGIRISVTGCDDSQQYDNPTYNLSNAVYGNFAIYAEHGMYGGLRPMTRKINRSMELTDMDCFVIVTKAVTLTLPAKPQRGQYYKFLQVGDNFVIKSSSNNMLWYGVSKNSFTSGALNQTTELIYDGSNWNVNWFIGK